MEKKKKTPVHTDYRFTYRKVAVFAGRMVRTIVDLSQSLDVVSVVVLGVALPCLAAHLDTFDLVDLIRAVVDHLAAEMEDMPNINQSVRFEIYNIRFVFFFLISLNWG